MGLPTPPVLDATEDTKAAHLQDKDKDKDKMEDAISRNRSGARTRHRSAGDCRLDAALRRLVGRRRSATAFDAYPPVSLAMDTFREQD